MVLILENENEAFLKALKAMAKAFNVKITTKEQNLQNEKELIIHKKRIENYKKDLKSLENGTLKLFSIDEAFENVRQRLQK